ncbi:hypothetical protein PSEUBRA_005890 [Kalmanozyma brasiliensis GHG001]|uniref:Uncharacterized protein n=1 Tax=Kalmanozyma brasiliensis (strain GHG001) TaxID=1365824 RepID=V5E4I6_KALBG|nr:uncharacterized protein PSEUBRA_005890 [Kalmanozyma brasiliensis GHG001]EST05081.1 hypothetical protein PSEUBRA_005890 [Kalmanozyma brasiliensis GHG001]
MSQCPLGFKGTPPPGHPKVAGLADSLSGSDAAASDSSTPEKAGWNPWLLLAVDAAFILLAIYIARNGVPRAIADPVKAAFTKAQPRNDAKVE